MIRRNSYRVTGLALVMLAVVMGQPWRLLAQSPEPAKGVKFAQISEADMKTWLTYLSSDELQGRQIFTEGYGTAAQYIADRLKEWGVKPLGENGSYFQPVKLKDYRVVRDSTVKVEVNGESRTFKQGEGVTFAATSGGNQTLNFSSVYFAGYATQAELDAKPLKDQLVVSVPNRANQAAGRGGFGGGGGGRGRAGGPYALSLGAKAYVSYVPTPAAPTPAENSLSTALTSLADATSAVTQAQQAVRGGGAGLGRGRGAAPSTACTPPDCDFRTVQKVDGLVPPQFSGSDAFYEFLFSGGPVKFADIKAKAEKGEPIAGMSIPAKVTVTIDNKFEVVRMQLSKNVVGMIEGSDPVLKNTYVMFGAHLDHVGYSPGRGTLPSPTGCRRRSEVAQAAVVAAGKPVQRPSAPARGAGAPGAPAAAGQAAGNRPGGAGAGAGGQGGAQAGRGAPAVALTPAIDEGRDFIYNGADDDGSGSTTELAVAKAFATGPKPKRSLVFVWHTGEEAGLYGSVYNADFPVVPLDKVQADLNMDMVGRDDCNNIEGDFSNTVFLVGADRISTDLHNLIVQTNGTLTKPLTLDYELNDAADPEGVYTRSDHYSYAAKGIPIAFFTTGLHPDYHRVSDTVEKITFPKMARIGQLVYQTAFAIANSEKTLERDNKGPRTGFGSKPEVIKK